ncbi:MAG: low molecular weight phosphotyrosine protein phosphatase [Acidobacteria bacterium]|nr:low molecular weight phosphotyrosine protein phosphatase [Acidobacteriota bacterium]
MNILFVCTANICRSPVAEHYLRHLVTKLGPGPVTVLSAGTAAIAGASADPIAARLAAERGCDLSTHRSRPLDRELLAAADEIVVMERRHRAWIHENEPSVLDKVSLLCESDGRDLADPTGGALARYRAVFEQLFAAVEKRAFSIRYPR